MPDPDPTWLDYLSAIGAITTPILVLGLTAMGWKIRHGLERRFDLDAKLREDRITAYNEILEPFIILLMSDPAWKADPKNKGKDKNQLAMQTMLSLAYRRHAFKLSLVGADSVVKRPTTTSCSTSFIVVMAMRPTVRPDQIPGNS